MLFLTSNTYNFDSLVPDISDYVQVSPKQFNFSDQFFKEFNRY